jgi:hypothetical protein
VGELARDLCLTTSTATTLLQHSYPQNHGRLDRVEDPNSCHFSNHLVKSDILLFVTSILAAYISDVLQVAVR